MRLRLLFFFLALRLTAWAFLLPPWAGFDEPYHHGYVETCADRFGWYSFDSVNVPDRLVASLQRWPLVSGYARQFHARGYESTVPMQPQTVAEPNYETLQSPVYYNLAGAILRAAPRIDGIAELYALRLFNAAMAFLVAILLWQAARVSGFGSVSWIPVGLLAFIPGFSLALVRVSNDALCALVVSISILAALDTNGDGQSRRPFTAALFAGLSPWTKLYGWAAVPAIGFRLRESAPRRRFLYFLALLGPGALLALLSRWRNGNTVSLLETLRKPKPVGIFEVPWLRDGWTVVKTHLWVSGMSTFVFPNFVYLLLAAAMLALLLTTISAVKRFHSDPIVDEIPVLGIAIGSFAVELAYFSWKNFAFYRASGGAGGWYLWSMALPEALLLTWGVVRNRQARKLYPLLLVLFLALTVAGDVVMFAEPGGGVQTSGIHRHIAGIAGKPASVLMASFLSSRPRSTAWLALLLAPASWATGLSLLAPIFFDRRRAGADDATIAMGGSR